MLKYLQDPKPEVSESCEVALDLLALCKNEKNVIATVDYGSQVVAAVGKENIVGLQFHPEKSQTIGLKCIQNFISWRP